MKKVLFFLSFFIYHFSLSQSWQPVGTGIEDTGTDGNAIYAFGVFNESLYACGGAFGYCPKNNIAVLNAGIWDTVGAGLRDTGALCFLSYDSLLFVGGQFNEAGNKSVKGIATWDGTKWDSVGSGLDGIRGVYALCLYHNEVYAGGQLWDKIRGRTIHGIAKWNGTYWDSVSAGIHGNVIALTVYNGELYAAGQFDSAGKIPANNIARWNGTKWDSVGYGVNSLVWALTVYNGKLYAGGFFTAAEKFPVNYIASWNGTKWDSVGAGVNGSFPNIRALATYNYNLYAGGQFTQAGGKSVSQIAKWNDTVWSAVGAGFNGASFGVLGLMSYDSSLYAGGDFTKSGSTTLMGVAKWRDSIILGENEIDAKTPLVRVYPNPANNAFTIELAYMKVQSANICLFNNIGEEVIHKTLNYSSTRINTSNLASGLYYYRITDMNGNIMKESKLIITH